MWSIWFIISLLLLGEAQTTESDLSCVSDYIKTISCEWNSKTWITGQNCTLQAIRTTHDGIKKMNCSLNTTRSCSVDMLFTVSFSTVIDVKVWCNQTWMDEVKRFKPGRHVKLHPPGQPKINGTVLMWSQGAKFSKLLDNYFFELQIKSKQQSWEEVKPIQVYGMSMSVDNASMCARECEARVRIKPTEPKSKDQIRGTWSDWSPSVTWKTTKIPDTSNFTHSEVRGIMVGFAVLVLILLFLTPLSIYRHKCGMKMRCEHIPDPSKYFQPLIIEHKGNFQAWLGSQQSSSLFLPSQSFNCEISPINEVSEAWGSPLTASTLLLYSNQTATQPQMMDTSQFSSGVSNMGYFYSEHQPGSVCLDSCPVYFTYRPEGGSLQASMSYERLQAMEPTSPDSGFGMEAEKEEEDYEEHEDDEDAKTGNGPEECSGINMQHLVSFVLSVPESSKVTVPPCFTQLAPWHEEAESPRTSANSESQDSPAVRPSSMVVQPCNSGYLTLKEMQKYSNKSI